MSFVRYLLIILLFIVQLGWWALYYIPALFICGILAAPFAHDTKLTKDFFSFYLLSS